MPPSSTPASPLTPHGPGFSFIDTAELVVQARPQALGQSSSATSAIATKFLDPALPFFAHHFPDQPLMPGVLMIEAAAQAAGWLWSSAQPRALDPSAAMPSQPLPLHLASVQGFRFISPALPGETLVMEVSLDKELGPLAQFSATLRVGDRRVAEGRLTLSRPG